MDVSVEGVSYEEVLDELSCYGHESADDDFVQSVAAYSSKRNKDISDVVADLVALSNNHYNGQLSQDVLQHLINDADKKPATQKRGVTTPIRPKLAPKNEDNNILAAYGGSPVTPVQGSKRQQTTPDSVSNKRRSTDQPVSITFLQTPDSKPANRIASFHPPSSHNRSLSYRLREFVEELKRRPSIYSAKFRNCHKRREQVQELSAIFGVPVKEVVTKYQSLRTQYIRLKRKLDEQLASGKSFDEVRPTWPYFEMLTFLSDDDVEPTDVEPQKHQPQDDYYIQEDHTSYSEKSEFVEPTDQIEIELGSDIGTEDGSKKSFNVNVLSDDNSVEQPHCSTHRERRQRRRNRCNTEQPNQTIPRVIHNTGTTTAAVDDNDLFGRMVAAGLRSIEDNRKRALCKLKIHEVMFNFQFGPSEDNELLNPASSTASTLSLTTL